MTVSIAQMRKLISANGHLVQDGTESKADLTEALIHLRAHTYGRCKSPAIGTPIEALIPDISVLVDASTKNKPVNVAVYGERF